VLVERVIERLTGGTVNDRGENDRARAHDVGHVLCWFEAIVVALVYGLDGVLVYEPTRMNGSRVRFGAVW
jgi:hypothetical protein